MTEQRVREIAEGAFRARFGGIEVVSVTVKPGFDYYDDPMVDVSIVYDGEFEQLDAAGILQVQSDIVDMVLDDDPDNSPGWPLVHLIAKSDMEEHELATA